jgi:hypothetical protein
MPALIVPTVDVHASFLAVMAEFMAKGRGNPDPSKGRAFNGRCERDLEGSWRHLRRRGR